MASRSQLFLHILLLSAAVANVFADSPPTCEAEIERMKQEIAAAQNCQQVSDCVWANFGCPWGCGTPINPAAVAGIKQHIEEHHARPCPACEYRCLSPEHTSTLACIHGKCRAIPKTVPTP